MTASNQDVYAARLTHLITQGANKLPDALVCGRDGFDAADKPPTVVPNRGQASEYEVIQRNSCVGPSSTVTWVGSRHYQSTEPANDAT